MSIDRCQSKFSNSPNFGGLTMKHLKREEAIRRAVHRDDSPYNGLVPVLVRGAGFRWVPPDEALDMVLGPGGLVRLAVDEIEDLRKRGHSAEEIWRILDVREKLLG